MSVIGFDFGNLSCYTACARAGGIETLANEYSSRNTPSFVSLSGKQRLMGTAAQQALVTNLKNTVFNLKRLVGRNFSDPRVQFEKQHFSPFTMVEGSNNSILIQANYMGETSHFTPEQITAMLFTKLKDAGEVALEKKICDCVISVPAYFTDHQRRRLLDASAMANLNCLKLMNETTAVALSYGIYKQDLPNPEEKPRNVVFVDFGHSSLQASVVAFHKGKLKMLATACDPDIGGRNFDLRLAEHFNEDFKKRYKIDAKTNPRAMIRLMSEAEKLKKLMSANSTDLPLNIECFMEDKDVTARMKREDFEAICTDLFQRVNRVLEDLMAKCGLNVQEVHSVEVIGGGSRFPLIKTMVKDIFGLDCMTTLNADEAVARGCALQCAILSPTFRVRDFKVDDCQNFPVNLVYHTADGEEQEMEVFQQWSQVPMSKMLTFYRKEPFSLQAIYGKPTGGLPYPTPTIGHFIIKDVVPTAEGDAAKVKVKVRVDIHGIFKVSQAQMVEKFEKPEEEPAAEKADETSPKMETENVTPVESTTIPEGAPDAAPPPGGDVPMDDPYSAGNPEAPTTTEADAAAAAAAAQEMEAATKETTKDATPKDEKKKNKVRTVNLGIESHVSCLTPDQLNHYIEMENEMIMQDKQEKERQDAKNCLEEYVYEMRSKCNDEYQRFVKEDDKDKYVQILDATEEWLYDEGEDQTRSIYSGKLAELKKIGQPIVDRFVEFSKRPRAFEDLSKAVQKVLMFVDLHGKADEKYAHIAPEDAAKAGSAALATQAWMEKMLNEQAKLPLFAPPVVLSSAIVEEQNKLNTTCRPIVNKPKPKPPKVEPPPVEPAKEDAKAEVNGELPDSKAGEVNGSSNSNSNSNAPPNIDGEPTQGGPDMDLD